MKLVALLSLLISVVGALGQGVVIGPIKLLIATQTPAYFTNSTSTNVITGCVIGPIPAGTYEVSFSAMHTLLDGNLASLATNRVAIYRTNNTPAYVRVVPIIRSVTAGTFEAFPTVGSFSYTATDGDYLELHDCLSVSLVAGAFVTHDAYIKALRIVP